jgi:cytochrome b pre-mRNA-processing protein 3
MRLRGEGERGVLGQGCWHHHVWLDHACVNWVSAMSRSQEDALGESCTVRAWEPALRDGDAAALAAGLARNVYESEDAATGEPLAAYALASRSRLAAQTFDAVTNAPQWAETAA